MDDDEAILLGRKLEQAAIFALLKIVRPFLVAMTNGRAFRVAFETRHLLLDDIDAKVSPLLVACEKYGIKHQGSKEMDGPRERGPRSHNFIKQSRFWPVLVESSVPNFSLKSSHT